MVRKLAVRSLRRGIGSMDYISTLLIVEDDLDEETEDMGEFGEHSEEETNQPNISDPPQNHPSAQAPDWCKCGYCQPVPQEIENRCCKLKKCISLTSRFEKLCLDPDVILVTSETIKKTTVLELLEKLPTGNLFWQNMAISERAMEGFAHLV